MPQVDPGMQSEVSGIVGTKRMQYASEVGFFVANISGKMEDSSPM